VHLYSSFWRKSRSNRASPKQIQADATSPALQRAGAAPERAVPRLGVWALPRPEAALPQATRPTGAASESTPSSRRAPSGRRTPTDRRSVPRLPCRSHLPRPALTPRSVAVGPSAAGNRAGRHKGVAAPCIAPSHSPRSSRVVLLRQASSHGELQAPAGCVPKRAAPHLPSHLQ
jgi:hypothetical protein